MALEVVRRSLAHIVKIRRESASGPDNLGHHSDGERAGADSGITNGNVRKFLIDLAGI